MNRENEDFLWGGLHLAGAEGLLPRDIIGSMLDEGMIESPKQAWRTLEKWGKKGWYNYGVSLDLGWKEVSERPNKDINKGKE
jgi:hypothetical protein